MFYGYICTQCLVEQLTVKTMMHGPEQEFLSDCVEGKKGEAACIFADGRDLV